jgi:hypothetical protein
VDFNRSELKEKWEKFYQQVGRAATIKRKEWMRGVLSSPETVS